MPEFPKTPPELYLVSNAISASNLTWVKPVSGRRHRLRLPISARFIFLTVAPQLREAPGAKARVAAE